MFSSRLTTVFCLTSLVSIGLVSGDCDGCSGSSCVELVDDAVYGCYGTFSSGIISDSALGDCARNGGGYHLCESANEAELLGLTANDCQNKVPAGHHFWSLESSVDYQQEGQCYSKNGPVTYNDRPRDDIWGCASSQTDISNCGSIHNQGCGPFNKACDAPETGSPWEEDGVWMCPCEGIELFTMAVTDASLGGVVCCSDTIPTDLGSNCDESITIWRINPGFVVPTPNFAPYVGKYTYYGNTNAGYPRYVHQESGTEISLSLLFNRLVITFYSDYDVLYSTATSVANGVVVNAGNNRFEIVEDFFSPPGTDMSASLINNDQIPFYNPDVTTDSNNPLSDFQVVATFSDCANYGLELVPSINTPAPTPATTNPTPSPTPNPTPPTPKPSPQPSDPTVAPVPPTPRPTNQPVVSSQCPNYDHTIYPDCNGDSNCNDCQPWGCAQCNTGYYKMGNLKRCQSCSANYQDCNTCGDWNGCLSCNNGLSLQYNPACSDETCQ